MSKIRVLIADDHPMIRQGLKQILEMEEDMDVVAQASNGREAVRLAREHKPDIILMDINMPEMDGLQAIREIKKSAMPSRVIMLTIHEDREYLFKALQIGAEGYVLKDAETSVLVSAIRSVNNGQAYIQPNMTRQLVTEFNRIVTNEKVKKDENTLTSRELDVIVLIAEGMINKEIGKKLFISEKTVKNHVSNIFRKLDVSDRTQAAIYAYKHNMKKL
ncbi:MAG: response regulator transcription factor [Clostridiales bacterium]|nr:response regulator transcription factor [Clostridiales bacterium]